MKILSLLPWPQGHLRGGDGADKNFRPISTIMPNMNEIHQRIFKIWGLINFNAKSLTLWRKDERTNVRTYVRTEKRKLYTPTYFVCRGYKYSCLRSPLWHSLHLHYVEYLDWRFSKWPPWLPSSIWVQNILAILNLYFAPMPPNKFQLHLNYSLGGDIFWRFSRWRTWRPSWISDWLIVLGFNDTSTLEGHFVSSPREREKRDRRESRGDEREGQGRKRNRNESEETEEIKTFPLYPYPLQG